MEVWYRDLSPKSELRAKHHKALLNSLGAEIEDLAKPGVGTLADAPQVRANQKIRLVMQPARPSLPGALRGLGILNNPAAAEWGGESARRRVITQYSEHGLASIMGPGGLFYADMVGTSGAAPACRSWDLLVSAAHRWAPELVGRQKSIHITFPAALSLAEDGAFGEPFLLIEFSYDSRIPFHREKFWTGGRTGLVRVPN